MQPHRSQFDHRAVRLVSTATVTSPFCWQFHQPYIVIPEKLLTFDQEDLKFILRHELAHLRTGHPLQVFLQRAIEIAFWFHPVVWWASREWSLAREFQCDDEAVESRSDIVRYLKTLLSIAEQASGDHQLAATLAFIRNRCEMAERARRLVRIAQHDDRTETQHTHQRRIGIQAASLIAIALVSISIVWVPVNVLASPAARWSPWPAWTAHVLHDFGVQTRDFEVYDHRYALHELFDDGPIHRTPQLSSSSSPAMRSE
jgi:bla regulator protein blaR1